MKTKISFYIIKKPKTIKIPLILTIINYAANANLQSNEFILKMELPNKTIMWDHSHKIEGVVDLLKLFKQFGKCQGNPKEIVIYLFENINIENIKKEIEEIKIEYEPIR